MKINKLQIGSFGKFNDYELELKDGFQVVYGKNEDGKSTLMSFIKMMFYSKLGSGRDIDKNLRKKYQPWDGSKMNGAIEFENDGIVYRLQKDIGATPSGDRVSLINMSTGETIPLGKNEEVGKRFFGLDLAGFERSVFINKLGCFSAGGNDDEVAEKLMSNLVLSGDEAVSQQEVINRINRAIEDMESKSRKKGILVDAKKELEDLLNERANIQALENDQQENLKNYEKLQERLNDQKSIQNLLNLHLDKNKFEQLSSLIEKIIKNNETEKELEKGNIHYNNIKDFLNECRRLMEDSEKTKGSLEKLMSSIGNQSTNEDNPISISEEEYNRLKDLAKKQNTVNELLKRVDENFIPALTSLIEARNDFNAEEDLLKKEDELIKGLRRFHEEYELCQEELKNTDIAKKDLAYARDKDEARWNSDRQLREQNIKFLNEKILLQSQAKESGSEKGKNKTLFIISIIIGVISIALMAIHPGFIIGAVIAAAMGIFGAKSNNKNRESEKQDFNQVIYELKKELEGAREENEREENLIGERVKQYDDELLKFSDAIFELEKRAEAVKEKDSIYQNAINNYTQLKSSKEMAERLLKVRQETYSNELNYLLNKYSDDSSLEGEGKITILQQEGLEEFAAGEYRSGIDRLFRDLDAKIKEKLEEKSCVSVKDYEDKYLKYASDSKNRKAINDAKDEYNKKAEAFIHKVNEYEITRGYEDAILLIQTLWDKVTGLEGEKAEAASIGKGMGYSNPSLEYLMLERSKLEPSIKQLEDVDLTGIRIEEMQQRLNELKGENIQEQILELQKKIRTPDKNLSQIDGEIEEKKKEVNEKQFYLDCLKIAGQAMEEASDEMRQSFGPELNKKTAGIFKSLTNGRYGNILVTKDYDISIQSGIHYREWKYLSNGTVDQAYLALRIAITELISDKNTALPLFLDDVLVQYDDERMDAALKFISDYAKGKGQEFQVLLFTCHQHIIDIAKPYYTEVITI